jgi:hypothetical protein
MESTMSDNEEPPATPEAGSHAAKARRPRRKTKTTQIPAPDSAAPTSGESDFQAGEPKNEWTSQLPDPFGRHNIDLGDGRRLKLLRSHRWQQAQMVFTAPEGQDPKPDPKYTGWLRDHGWTWRNAERAWTKQLARNSEEQRYARANSDRAHEEEFIELANLIRQDRGLPPVHQLEEQRGVG